MLKICLVFWKSEPQYAYKRYAYKKNMYCAVLIMQYVNRFSEEVAEGGEEDGEGKAKGKEKVRKSC